jgi:MFS family permease
MTGKPGSKPAASGDIDYRLLIPFLTHVVIAQSLIFLMRITTSYRVIELGLPVVWLGLIATGFAIIPAVSALQVGRWIDRGNDAKSCWVGTSLIFISCLGFWAWPRSALHLFGFSVILGFGHMFCMAGHQMLAVRSGGSRSRESVLGTYSVAASLGQGFGPFVVGWLGGSAAVPPTGKLFAIGVIAAAVSVVVALAIRPSAREGSARAGSELIPVRQLLKLRGFTAVMASSVATITALDLLVIYLPLLGAERHIDSNHIGLLLTSRSIAALISRAFYARLIFAMGRVRLTLASMLASGAAFALLMIPLSLPAMYLVLIGLGFVIGISSTLTISSVVHLAPPAAWGTALTLRMTGNRIGQIVFPALAGLLAAATGTAGIMLALGLALAASGIAVALRQPDSSV